jgi:hypothetical protein
MITGCLSSLRRHAGSLETISAASRYATKRLTPAQMVAAVQELAAGWTYEAVSIGYPVVLKNSADSTSLQKLRLGRDWAGL